MMTSDETRKLFIRKFLKEHEQRQNVLYINTPFCTNKCSYCIYKSTDKYNLKDMEHFNDTVLKSQIENYKEILDNVIFDQVYFGGGTPTVYSPERLRSVFDSLPNFREIKKKCIEASPLTLKDEHIKVLQNYDFSYISVGIQSLDSEICKKHNRPYFSKIAFSRQSEKLAQSGIYFNYDLICYLNHGDIRDTLQFKDDLTFVMKIGLPHSVTIHQLYQSFYTTEKTAELIKVIRDVLKSNSRYTCANSKLEDADVFNDTLYNAEYKLERDGIGFSHYLWSKYPTMPVEGCNILSLGFYKNHNTISSAGQLIYCEGNNEIKQANFNHKLYDEYMEIRNEMGLQMY